MKKLFHATALAALGFVSNSHAAFMPFPLPFCGGNFLVGLSGSYAERLDNVDITLVYTSPPSVIPSSFIIEDYTDTGYQAGFFFGYQGYLPYNLVLGIEFNIDWDYLDHKHYFGFSDANGQVNLSPGIGYAAMATYERDTTYGLSLRLGYEVTPCFMPYGRIGIAKSKDTLMVAFAGDPAIYNYNVITHGDHPNIRYILGLGFEIPMPYLPFIGIRAEYNYESRGKNTEALGGINDGVLNPFFMNKMNPRTQVGKIALVWNI